MNRLLVTGATGFTGGYVVPLLRAHGYVVRCFVRPTSDLSRLSPHDIELVHGDLSDTAAFTRALMGCEALVNIASLGFGHAPGVVQSMLDAKVRRAVFVSTTAVETRLNAASKSVRLAAEESIRSSSAAWTILRPTMIYGSARDRNMCRLIRYLRRWPVIPVFGTGNSLQQPVYVADVAGAIVEALRSEKTIGKTYNISGAKAVTYNEVIDTVARLMCRKVLKIHVPASPCVTLLTVLERISRRLPLKAEQVQRLNEDKCFDYGEAARDFDYHPRTVAAGLTEELKEMGLLRSAAS